MGIRRGVSPFEHASPRTALRRSRAARFSWVPRPGGGFGFAALRPAGLFSRPSGALQRCRLWRQESPGPAPAGGPTSCAPKKSAEEGRSRGLPPVPLRNPREYLAITRGLPSLPTGTQAVGTIQVAGAPNDGNNGAASLPGGGTRGRVADPPPARRTRIGLPDRGVSCGQGPQLTCALRSQRPKPDGSPGTHGGKQRPFRAFARSARVRGFAAQFSASPWALRATQKRPCLPGRTSGTVPETRRQRHCARGAASGGML